MFEQVFKNLDRVLRFEDGCTTELDYTEQSSWILFLKYLDDLEQERAQRAELKGEAYRFIIDDKHRWSRWAAPKKKDGSFDHDKAMTGDDLIAYVNDELFPYLRGFKQRATGPDTIEYKIGQIFAEIKNKFISGYSLRDALELIDQLRFGSQAEKHELSELYEVKIKRMGNAGRNGGEYYTPRPLIRAMIQVIQPKIGERIYDGAVGSAGFLCEAFTYMRPKAKSTSDLDILQRKTLYGVEKKPLAFVIAIMNMILHGIDAPNIVFDNTLGRALSDIQPKDQFDVILANPPFGGGERPEVQQNFPIRSGETAYLFLQHFMKMLKPGGRAAVVIKNTALSNGDAAALRKELLDTCNLHTVLDCPSGTFQGAGVKTVVLFFEKGAPTRDIWFYQLDPGRSLGKTTALTDADFEEFVRLQATRADSDKSWTVKASDLDATTYDMAAKNPSHKDELTYRDPSDIIDEMMALDADGIDLQQTQKRAANESPVGRLEDVVSFKGGGTPSTERADYWGGDIPWVSPKDMKWDEISDAEDKITPDAIAGSATNLIPVGAVLVVVRSGILARTVPIGITTREVAINQDIKALCPNPTLLPKYLFYFLRSAEPRLLRKVSRGATVHRLSTDDLRQLKISVPPLAEQKRIVAVLDEAFEEIAKATANAERKLGLLGSLKISLLDSLLSPSGGDTQDVAA